MSAPRVRLGTLATAMVTPFDAAERLDLGAAVAVAEHLLATGTDSLFLAGTTGESPALEDAEKLALFRAVKEAAGTRAVVVAGTGSNNTRHAAEFSRAAQQCGVDAIMSVVPAYSKPPQDGLRRHFGAVAAATPLPVVVYNIPSRTGVNLLPATLLQIARENATIAGVKESSGDLAQISAILRDRDPAFVVLCGDDHLFLPTLALGADGLVSVAAHVAGRELRELLGAFRAGDVARAARSHLALSALFAGLFAAPSPIPVKWALARLGLAAGPCRSPLGAMPEALARDLGPLLAALDAFAPARPSAAAAR